MRRSALHRSVYLTIEKDSLQVIKLGNSVKTFLLGASSSVGYGKLSMLLLGFGTLLLPRALIDKNALKGLLVLRRVHCFVRLPASIAEVPASV
jgi:hypothetical protein